MNFAAAILGLALPFAGAQNQKPVVLGTQQLAGEFGKFGTTYTVGEQNPLNFSLISAEYRADRFIGGEWTGSTFAWVPDKTQKLLVIHYTIQNPVSRDQTFTYQSWDMVAVSADSQNAKAINKPWVGSNRKYQDVVLKPGQKITATVAFLVSADGETPKLIVQRGFEPTAAVVRYDLRGKVAKLPAQYSDDGYTAKPQVDVGSDAKFAVGGLDLSIKSFAKADGPITLAEADGAKEPWVMKIEATAVAPNPARLWYGALKIRVKTEDGDSIDVPSYQRLLRASRDETFDGVVPEGDSIIVRLILELPKGVKPKSVIIQPFENDVQRRTFVYRVAS